MTLELRHVYPMGLKLYTPVIDLSKPPYPEIIRQAAAKYNQNVSLANPKELEIIRIDPHELIVTLNSSVPLQTPGRALRYFSQLLASGEEFKPALPGGKLFLSFPIVPSAEDKTNILRPEDISDERFMSALCRYFIGQAEKDKKRYRAKREAVTKMKAIALEYGFLSGDEQK